MSQFSVVNININPVINSTWILYYQSGDYVIKMNYVSSVLCYQYQLYVKANLFTKSTWVFWAQEYAVTHD